MAQLLFLLGPPAVGKSTVLSELDRDGLSTVSAQPGDNPYFAQAWSDPAAAYASQRWFIRRIRRLLCGDRRRSPIFLEDDPQIAPALHSKALCRSGLLSEAQTLSLAALSRAEFAALRAAGHSWDWAFLDAPEKVLLERLHRRGGAFSGDREWLSLLASDFRRAAADADHLALRTDERPPAQIAEQLASFGTGDR